MSDEFVGDRGQSDLGDVELVLGNELKKKVKGAFENREVNLKPRTLAADDSRAIGWYLWLESFVCRGGHTTTLTNGRTARGVNLGNTKLLLARHEFASQLAIGICAIARRGIRGDRLTSNRGLWELDGAVDDRVEYAVAKSVNHGL